MQILSMRFFMENEGYKIEDNILYQDNKSGMILERKGNTYVQKNKTYKVEVFFFIQDKVENGEVNKVYCLTERMWLDMLTKPLQGQQFRQMRSMVMNCPIDYEDSNYSNRSILIMYQDNPETSSQECV